MSPAPQHLGQLCQSVGGAMLIPVLLLRPSQSAYAACHAGATARQEVYGAVPQMHGQVSQRLH
jgi:hypothetical protein